MPSCVLIYRTNTLSYPNPIFCVPFFSYEINTNTEIFCFLKFIFYSPFHLSAHTVISFHAERTINLMMFDMSSEVANIFYKQSSTGEDCTGKEMTAKSGIDHLCPGATIDETAFTPCGYSMNAILHDSYFTIHITPEKECSYASFETNTSLKDYASMVRNVLNVFKPKRFVLTMFGDEGAVTSIFLFC